MTETVSFYGFGSHFSGNRSPLSDIDVLLLHKNVAPASIDFVIRCKRLLMEVVPSAHIVMLSKEEASELDFVRKSKAVLLCEIVEGKEAGCVYLLKGKIAQFGVASAV